METSKKVLLAGVLCIVLPLLLIYTGGIAVISDVMGQGEGFAYFLVYVMVFIILAGMVLFVSGLAVVLWKKKTNRRKGERL